MSNDMFFDTNTFDFSSLTDVVGLNEDSEVNGYADKNSDVTDLGLDPVDINQNAEDLYTPEEDDREDYAHLLDSLDDTAYLSSLGMTKGEIKQLREEKERIDSQRDLITESFKNFETETNTIMNHFQQARTALDMNEEILQGRLDTLTAQARRYGPIDSSNPYAAELGEVSAQLREVANGKREVAQRSNDVMQKNHARQLEAIRVNELHTDYQLKSQIPNFEQEKNAVINYAKTVAGFDDWEFAKAYKPGLFLTLQKAMKYDQNLSKAQDKAKATRDNIKHARSMSGNKAAPVQNTNTKEVFDKLGSSRDANVRAFAHLKD